MSLVAPTPSKCFMCGRTAEDVGSHVLPVLQAAHCVAKRFTKGANGFTDSEWVMLLSKHGRRFGISAETDAAKARRLIRDRTYLMCGECHEEVLSEPLYPPHVLEELAPFFHGKSRLEKMLLLSEIIELGIGELQRRGPGTGTVGH